MPIRVASCAVYRGIAAPRRGVARVAAPTPTAPPAATPGDCNIRQFVPPDSADSAPGFHNGYCANRNRKIPPYPTSDSKSTLHRLPVTPPANGGVADVSRRPRPVCDAAPGFSTPLNRNRDAPLAMFHAAAPPSIGYQSRPRRMEGLRIGSYFGFLRFRK